MGSDSTILIVDDETPVREMLYALLDGQNYDLVFANGGVEALAKATEYTPDLILLDVMMPDMNGFEVCQRLRADPFLAEVPIIMVTGLGDRESRLKGIESGADDFLAKPFDRTDLLARIRTITRLNRYRKLESKITRLSALYDTPSPLNSSVDTDALLGFIVHQTKELLNVEGASILFCDKPKRELYFPIVTAEEENVRSRLKQLRFPIDSGIAGWVFREGKSAIVHDVSSDQRFYGQVDQNTGFITKSILCVPLHSRDGVLGVIEVVNKKRESFTNTDEHLLKAMAGNVAVSIEKANLYRDLQKAETLLKRQNGGAGKPVRQKHKFENIVGKSDKMQFVINQAGKVALTDATVLIYGETGTGKEILARGIHQGSSRASRNFVPINCGAIPASLLESELFGHEKGAFTSATARRIGRFEEANGGTLFLDEIGDMPMSLQVKLLRVLEEGIIRSLGSNQGRHVDVRVIAATHRNLSQLVAEGKFRQDLYYRLKVFELRIPPLCERREDIPLLIDHFIKHYNRELDKGIRGIEGDALEVLCNYDYPGNVRELRHIIETAMIISKSDMITFDIVPREVLAAKKRSVSLPLSDEHIVIPKNDKELKVAKAEAQRRIERMFLIELLSNSQGNVSQAAREAGMNRSWLSQLVSKHQLDLDEFRRSVS